MIAKLSWISIADNTNVNWLQIFHLYKGWSRRVTFLGFFVKGSARVVEPPRIEYKGFKFKFNRKGDICRSILVQVSKPQLKGDGSVFYSPQNNGFIIRKKQDLKSKYTFGPVVSTFKRRRFKTLFKTIL
jgi:ribosomal protein L14